MNWANEAIASGVNWTVAAMGGIVIWFVRHVMTNRELINKMEGRVIRIETQIEHLFSIAEEGNKIAESNTDLLKTIVKKIK